MDFMCGCEKEGGREVHGGERREGESIEFIVVVRCLHHHKTYYSLLTGVGGLQNKIV